MVHSALLDSPVPYLFLSVDSGETCLCFSTLHRLSGSHVSLETTGPVGTWFTELTTIAPLLRDGVSSHLLFGLLESASGLSQPGHSVRT